MLPPGHIAAGYLLAKSFIAVTKPALTSGQISWLVALGGFFGFVPDLDMFYIFWKEHGFHSTGVRFNHRQFITHTPFFWLVLGVFTAFIGGTTLWHYAAAVIVLGAWSHLLLDSMVTGVRWLWPFNEKFYALKNPGVMEVNMATGFWNHWWNLVKWYYRKARLTFWVEIIIIGIATIVFWISR